MISAKKIQNPADLVFDQQFDSIDGSHPLKESLPEGYVDYQARIRPGGKIRFFNFSLAKEMGLIDQDHPEHLSDHLKNKIIETFSLQIINEFDIENNKKFSEETIKSGTYMATRYLQLQHDNKQGKTSGDGRSIWNGIIKHKGKKWDLSSCGTGATCLSPATSKYNKFFETGDPSISYGCGYGELDEGMASALFSRVLKANNIRTEESLVVIEYKNNASVNVRAHRNLIRPSHLFLYLKQGEHDVLKRIVDYHISREYSAKELKNEKNKYHFLLNEFSKNMAQTVAHFEDQYIFCWLDWDGDNILMDGSIIDYGSVRQFGLFHHEYKYDDVERFSTNIKEQKQKARYMVQTFIQLIDYIESGAKKSMEDFKDHKVLALFDDTFETTKNENLLHKLGFGPKHSKQLLSRYKKDVESFRQAYSYFEKFKVKDGPVKISDGVTWDVVYSMRRLLREYPQVMLLRDEKLSPEDFVTMGKAESAHEENVDLNSYKKKKIDEFQDEYMGLVEKCAKLFQTSEVEVLQRMGMRSSVINKADRITGDAVTFIVDLLLKKVKNADRMYLLIDELSKIQNMSPELEENYHFKTPKGLLKDLLQIIVENREGI